MNKPEMTTIPLAVTREQRGALEAAAASVGLTKGRGKGVRGNVQRLLRAVLAGRVFLVPPEGETRVAPTVQFINLPDVVLGSPLLRTQPAPDVERCNPSLAEIIEEGDVEREQPND